MRMGLLNSVLVPRASFCILYTINIIYSVRLKSRRRERVRVILGVQCSPKRDTFCQATTIAIIRWNFGALIAF